MGIYAKNREEWVLIHLANMKNSITSVAFYDTLGPSAVEFVIKQTELTTISCAGQYVAALVKLKKEGKAKSLENLITFDKVPDNLIEEGRNLGVKIYHIDEVIEAGKKSENYKFEEPNTESIYMFCYTSGTTGDPKAVKLSHKNILASSTAAFAD